jgi:YebC/PmpR family DNA-binding regulatory protein
MVKMSGHSKWSTIKHKKAALDAKRGNIFTKLANAIAVAAKRGGSADPDFNFSLRLAIDKAKEANMPSDNIKRAIDRGLGKGAGAKELEEITLEGYGPEGIAVIVEIVSDNRNRSVSEIKTIFDKTGGRLGEPGSVLYQFERVGSVLYQGSIEEEMLLKLIELGVKDFGEGELLVEVGKENEVANKLSELGLSEVEAVLSYRSDNFVEVKNREVAAKFILGLEEHDDVQGVYANYR